MLYAELVDQVETGRLRQKEQSVYFESVGIEKKIQQQTKHMHY